jgi:acetyl esterase/lipase
MKKLMPLFFLFIHLLISGCSKQPVDTVPSVNEDIILNNVSFGTDEAQKMDVYLPKNRTAQTKVIVFIHGGGWYMGDKREIKEGAVYFQQQGFTFISINYRLTRTSQHNIHPAQMEDIDKAVNTIIAKSKEWNVSDSKLVFWGGSAGSHLSMLYAYKYNNSKKIKAVISTSGPADLTDTTFINSSIGGLAVEGMITDYIGYPFSENPQAWRDASPVNYINAASVPSMFIHGTADSTVPFHQSETAFKKFQNYGLPSVLKPLPGIGHSLEGVNWAELLPLVIQFINSYTQ